jgi:hypothetical protein
MKSKSNFNRKYILIRAKSDPIKRSFEILLFDYVGQAGERNPKEHLRTPLLLTTRPCREAAVHQKCAFCQGGQPGELFQVRRVQAGA